VRGKQPHPRINDVEALTTFSGVPVTYFFDDDVTARIDDQIAQVSAWRDYEARHIAERVTQLSPRDGEAVTNLIDRFRAYDEQPRAARPRRKPMTSDESQCRAFRLPRSSDAMVCPAGGSLGQGDPSGGGDYSCGLVLVYGSAANRGSTTFCGRPASPIPGTSTTFSTGLNVIVAPREPSLVHIEALYLGRGCGWPRHYQVRHLRPGHHGRPGPGIGNRQKRP
jgi:hypothetical protein